VECEWDEEKAAANLRKHGVSFEEAATVFGDPLYIDFYDPDHSIEEHRYLILGTSSAGQLLIVSYTERDEVVRLISAREVTSTEEKFMKKVEPEADDQMRPEYDLRSLHVRKLGPGRKTFGDIVRLEPDVADAFPDADAVNQALRFLIRVAKENRSALRRTKN
jgi:uncharacterized protein